MTKRFIAGVDLGGTTVKLGLFTKVGKLKDVWNNMYLQQESLDYIKPSFYEHVFDKCGDMKFTLATLENNAGIYGAAGLFRNYEI